MADQRTGSNGKDDKANLNAGEKVAAKPQAKPSDVQEKHAFLFLNVQGKRSKKNIKKIKIKSERDTERTTPAEEWTGVLKSTQEGACENSKILFYRPPNWAATVPQGDDQQMAESEEGDQIRPVDKLEGSGEHNPHTEKSATQTIYNNKSVSIVACPSDRMEAYAENPPNLESASGKCMYNKELNDVPSIPFASETNFAEIEVHPRVRRRRHSDTEVSIDKILSLA
ncbi:Uncharacterized protein TCM_013382 [Theobroma cacao]|uniref:Uncharacterized protein n=1 Tax=Theobroma cacao TaxID=3641 RepID=A0A061G3G2_THECC|nr:Uncharacterized protein TCM_013382 [Theobroma cacao]